MDLSTQCLGAGCKATPRYELSDGRVACEEHLPMEPSRHAQPTGCQVFCATRAYDREHLGERVTEWLRTNDVEVTDTFIAQSSDAAFHCVTMVLFFRER